MTRREEIENHIGYKITKAAVEYYQANCANDVDLSDAFEAGAEWMQETMIEKVCKWMEDNLYGYFNYEGVTPEEISNDVISDFRKAMEE